MIYVVVATQILTVIAMLVIAGWVLRYLENRDKGERRAYEFYMNEVHKLVEAHDIHTRQLVDLGFKERENLLERVQHPEQTRAQAAGVGQPGGISVVDEETEAKEEGLMIVDEDEAFSTVGGDNGSS